MAESATWIDMEGGKQNGSLHVQFYRGTKRDIFNSIANGYPVDAALDYVKITPAGERDNIILEVDESHRRRWPAQWQAYKEGREQIGDGTPLDLLFPGNPEIVSTLKANNIHHVEQLAGYPESGGMKFAITYKQKAITFLEGRKENRFPELERRAQQAELELAEMRQMVQQLMAEKKRDPDEVEIATLAPGIEPVRRGPGRPPKQEV